MDEDQVVNSAEQPTDNTNSPDAAEQSPIVEMSIEDAYRRIVALESDLAALRVEVATNRDLCTKRR